MSLYAWGRNSFGQLGLKQESRVPVREQQQPQHEAEEQAADEIRSPVFAPLPLPKTVSSHDHKPVCVEIGDEHFVKVAAGEFHTLAVTQYGDVRAFGRGREGQLGHGRSSMLDTHVPQKVEGLSDATVVGVACGAFHSLAVTSTGKLYEWGMIHTDVDVAAGEGFQDNELLDLAGPTQGNIDPATSLSSVVTNSARQWLSATDMESSDGAGSGNDDNTDTPDDEQVRMQWRMMGRKPTRDRWALPRLVTSLGGMRVISVSAGYSHSVAVTDQGQAFSSGQNDRGQLGLAHRIHSGIFRKVVGMEKCFILEVACGEQHNLARVIRSRKALSSSSPAELYVWGCGRLGQLGLGSPSTRLAPTHNPQLSDTGGGVVSVSAGANHSVCALENGSVFGWGHAEYHQQGVAVLEGADLGTRDSLGHFRVPRQVCGLIGTHVVSVHCGSNFTLAVDRTGVTQSFGWNEGNVLGHSFQTGFDPSPSPVTSLPCVVNIAAGSRHAVAVTAEGPAVGIHLLPLVGDTESADVELLSPATALRGKYGVPAHMSVISARCPYLAGYIEAAKRAEREEGQSDGATLEESELPMVAELHLEHANADTIPLLARYLYTDEVQLGVPGKTLGELGGLAQELFLPRLEGLCVGRLPYYLRRKYIQRNAEQELTTPGVTDVPQSTFVNDLGELAGKSGRSDVLVVVPAWKWGFHCHKAIVCSSPWWHALLKGGFKERNNNTIDMSGMLHEGVTQPEAFEAAIRHIYTKSRLSVVDMDPSIVMEVVILAEFMVLPSLTSACQHELGRYVDVDSASCLARFARKYQMTKLEGLCLDMLRKTTNSPMAL